jgi:hypothetical protein
MASIYNITFTKFAERMLPPDKRNPILTAFLNALLVPLQWANQHRIVEYGEGSSAGQYDNAITYAKYDQVIYKNVVYQSIVDGNNSSPLDATKWMQIQSNFIGLNERLNYNGQCLVLTYALNKWFGTIFRQPPLQSDIWIETNEIVAPVFRSGTAEAQSSKSGTTGSTEYVGLSDTIVDAINATIHVPVVTYNALDPTLTNNEKIFRNFADKYIPGGIVYTIVTY